MPKDRGAEQGDVDALWSAAWLWEWWQLKHVGAWLPSRCRAAFHGLELTTPQTYSACRLNTQSGCRDTPIFSWEDQKNSLEQTIHDMQSRKMELWHMAHG